MHAEMENKLSVIQTVEMQDERLPLKNVFY